jgi:hypothetical protein
MQTFDAPKADTILHTKASCKESLYRTRWLMAHNRLHALVNDDDPNSPRETWNEYLRELETAEDTSSTSA